MSDCSENKDMNEVDFKSFEEIASEADYSSLDLFGDNVGFQNISEIHLDSIVSFANHPFRVEDDEDMDELVESIARQGVLVPVIVRRKVDNTFELISGHRRVFASRKLGLSTIKAEIKDLDDDEATLAMVNTNLHRTRLRFSEKAFAYKMRYDALKRIKEKEKENFGEYKTKGRARDIIASEGSGDSPSQIMRYIRLTYLNPELLDMVDLEKIKFNPAVSISYFDPVLQKRLLAVIKETGIYPTANHIEKLNGSLKNKLYKEDITEVLTEDNQKKSVQSCKIMRKLIKLIPEEVSPEQYGEWLVNAVEKYLKYLF